ncbi:MAG: hypothetical protein LBJ08_12545, partial [Bifidobacteriaceae bacterium]|nr:hypothetical protein [Bifidobacteriaceae bacterium]
GQSRFVDNRNALTCGDVSGKCPISALSDSLLDQPHVTLTVPGGHLHQGRSFWPIESADLLANVMCPVWDAPTHEPAVFATDPHHPLNRSPDRPNATGRSTQSDCSGAVSRKDGTGYANDAPTRNSA